MEELDTKLDANTFCQQARKLGLINESQMREALEEARTETGKQDPDLQHLLRILERRGFMTNWQSGKVLKGDVDGYFVGGYRVLYKIQSGSFGRVFRAEDPRTGRVVAVKVLRRRWSEDQQRIDLFIREGRVGLTLKHPNIVEVLAINQDPASKQYYLAMEFVEGGNLREILQRRKRLTPAESLRILEDCASGLTYAYSRGLTHRDIKLTNILISSHGEAKLVDFGLAHMFAALAREGEKVERTVDYAGLERTTEVKQGDVRSDIYFLGCVGYEMLTGRSPLVMTRDRHARMQRRRFEEVRPLRPGEVDAPPSVYQLIETMMALDPKRRYQTPSQMLDAIKACRRELEGRKASGGAGAPRSLFLVEGDQRLQDRMRDAFKEKGYRVFVALDPARALDRFRQVPYDALVVDAGTVGEEGVLAYTQILTEAKDKGLPCVALLILNEDQADWGRQLAAAPNAAVLVRPGVGFKQVHHTLEQLLEGARPPEQAEA